MTGAPGGRGCWAAATTRLCNCTGVLSDWFAMLCRAMWVFVVLLRHERSQQRRERMADAAGAWRRQRKLPRSCAAGLVFDVPGSFMAELSGGLGPSTCVCVRVYRARRYCGEEGSCDEWRWGRCERAERSVSCVAAAPAHHTAYLLAAW